MNSEIFNALFFQNPIPLKKLRLCKAILGISRIVHDSIAHFKHASGIVTAAHGFRQCAQNLFHKINMRDVIQVDNCAELRCVSVFLRRRFVGGKHNVFSDNARRLAEHQLRHRGTVAAAAILL